MLVRALDVDSVPVENDSGIARKARVVLSEDARDNGNWKEAFDGRLYIFLVYGLES